MSFFNFKKKKEEGEAEKKSFLSGIIRRKELEQAMPKEEHPPELPELPREAAGYTPIISSTEADLIKEAVAPAPPRPSPERPRLTIPKLLKRSKFRKEEAEEEAPMEYEEEHPIGEEKPLFVKIDTYRDVMETVKELKLRLKEATDIISELKKLKDEEDRELQLWHDELESIKNKLTMVDKKLFEV